MRAPVTSSKHYVQRSLLTITAGTNDVTVIVQAVERGNVSVGNAFEVADGSVIKAVFVEMWIRGQSTSPGSVLLSLIKTPQNTSITFAEQVALHTYDNKKNVLYHTQGLTNDADADAIPFVRQWFKIPKGKQRFGLGDKLVLSVSAQALDSNICGFMTYKEYT